ncbi:hypothetical protein SAMN05660845_2308 [Flavobacterium swingsii]|uniref:Uncharacterized protein n=1 Tax=Flavobacterium swingsii TaxID=498292 RepID=A0A1I0ZRH1_9FLAO|nr:hypothetical protein [Flavobacterium swingsii]SFB26948.1 hypothetical protein SAMN05660845_2308 [Flavobacterium swingsii]
MKQFDLDNDPKIDSGFRIPENYFEQFETKIMSQISEKEVKVISIFETRKFWFSAVAAVFVIGLFTTMYLNNIKTENISTEDYLACATTISTEDIIENLSDDDITAIEESLDLYDQDTQNYAKEYLY